MQIVTYKPDSVTTMTVNNLTLWLMKKNAFCLSSDFESLKDILIGKCEKKIGSTIILFNSERGRGMSTKIYSNFGVTTFLFDMTLKCSFNLELNESLVGNYFVYQSEGEEMSFKSIPKNKLNTVVDPTVNHDRDHFISLKLPLNINLKLCIITIDNSDYSESKKRTSDNDYEQIKSVLNQNLGVYLSNLYSPNLNLQLKALFEVGFNDIVDRLLWESNIMKLLAIQFSEFQLENLSGFSLTTREKNKIFELSKFIKDNLNDNLNLKNLSKHSGLSPRKMQLGFTEFFGNTVAAYILDSRLEFAKEVIETTNLPIAEIMYQCGLTSRSYFTKAFKGKYGVLPSNYRQIYTNNSKIYELVYTTVSDTEFDIEALKLVSQRLSRKFLEVEITGCLISDHKYVYHILEGSKGHIYKTLKWIREEFHSGSLITLWKGYKNDRDFLKWSIAIVEPKTTFKVLNARGQKKLKFMKDTDSKYIHSSFLFWSKLQALY